MGINVSIRAFEDSVAARGIATRTGLGKVRHIEVNQLWVQEKNETGELRYKKVRGNENPADALTKALVAGVLNRIVLRLGKRYPPALV